MTTAPAVDQEWEPPIARRHPSSSCRIRSRSRAASSYASAVTAFCRSFRSRRSSWLRTRCDGRRGVLPACRVELWMLSKQRQQLGLECLVIVRAAEPAGSCGSRRTWSRTGRTACPGPPASRPSLFFFFGDVSYRYFCGALVAEVELLEVVLRVDLGDLQGGSFGQCWHFMGSRSCAAASLHWHSSRTAFPGASARPRAMTNDLLMPTNDEGMPNDRMKNAEAAAEFGIWNSAFDIPSLLVGH